MVKVVWQDGDTSKAVHGKIVDDDVDFLTVQALDGTRIKINKKYLICTMEDP